MLDHLPAGAPEMYDEAAGAVRQEQRRAGRARLLTCHELVALDDAPGVFRIEIGAFSEVERSWEGARVFKPADLPEPDDPRALQEQAHDPGRTLWRGQVVEVDEDAGRLYVLIDGDEPPCTGRFVAVPYDFLEALCRLLHPGRPEPWRARVGARLGATVRPEPDARLPGVGPTAALRRLWQHPWGLLWGPPGTGKTWTIGRQVAAALAAGERRVLVISTTNRATDGAALQIGAALRDAGIKVRGRRIGVGADVARLEAGGLDWMLLGSDSELRREIALIARRHGRALSGDLRARLAADLQIKRRLLAEAGTQAALDPRLRLVITTAFGATRLLATEEVQGALAEGGPPFSTLILDEAGLISRASAAALSLWASDRALLVGDPRQLAPIAREARVLAPTQARWLAESGLGHLEADAEAAPHMLLLREQHRMASPIRHVVSTLAYGGTLYDAPSVAARSFEVDPLLQEQPRAIWVVLDEEGPGAHPVHAARGPSGRSWVRPRSLAVFERILSLHPQLAASEGLFLSPFRAQTRAGRELLARLDVGGGVTAPRWQASTVHAQQGAEAPYVVFDTVHAGSTGWPTREWQRLINVGLSRAREQIFVLASRAEMTQPYLAPLLPLLAPRVLRGRGGQVAWREVPVQVDFAPGRLARLDPHTLGGQIGLRKAQRPRMSEEQERLCRQPLDGRARLVRGVAGSGKTWVLATWLARTLHDPRFADLRTIWAVYGNRSLHGLLRGQLLEAWRQLAPEAELPWRRVKLVHVRDLLRELLGEVGLDLPQDAFDYDALAQRWLDNRGPDRGLYRCDGLFIDEAQDMGHHTLQVLFAQVRPWGEDAGRDRAVHVFYDNDQDIFGRGTPRWSELGLDLRGRAVVMKCGWRCSRPVAELARNLLYRLRPQQLARSDHREYVRLGLLEPVGGGAHPWWRERFNATEGPAPELHLFKDREAEREAIGRQVRRWVEEQGVLPGDVRLIVNGKEHRRALHQSLRRALADLPVRVLQQSSQNLSGESDTLVVTTAHSFKGHEAEVVVIAGVDTFVGSPAGRPRALARALYVAMSRARSLLWLSALQAPWGEEGQRIVDSLRAVMAQQLRMADLPDVGRTELLELQRRLGTDHEDWLRSLADQVRLRCEPVWGADGQVVATPLFSFALGRDAFACFERPLDPDTRRGLQAVGVRAIAPGEAVWGQRELGV